MNSKKTPSSSANSSKSHPNDPIGFFDSGVGGLTVMKEVVRLLPNENVVYFGDTARFPYGTKSTEAIIRFSLESASFLATRKIKLLIVACHTASSRALETLRQHLPIPVIGVVECAVSHLLASTTTNEVAILATSSTIASQAHASLLRKAAPHLKIHPVPCPLFAPLVEEGFVDHPATDLIAHHYLHSLRNYPIDAALLACTHYPLLHQSIQKAIGPHVQLVEPALTCAKQAKELLSSLNLLNSQTQEPTREFYTTDNPHALSKLATLFFGSEISDVKVSIISS
jgi:glutamate racemase